MTWPRLGAPLPPLLFDEAENHRLAQELGISGGREAFGSWAPRCRVADPPAGILEMFGEPVRTPGLPVGILGEGEEMPRPGWEMDHPVGRLALRARLMRFRPDRTAAYIEARLPGPGWDGTWELSIRGLELERAVRGARIPLDAVPRFRDWIRTAGRPSERAERIETYRAEILKLRAADYRPVKITATLVLRRLGRSGDDSQLRADVGGWAAYRAGVLAGE